jgi:hypothetical protein
MAQIPPHLVNFRHPGRGCGTHDLVLKTEFAGPEKIPVKQLLIAHGHKIANAISAAVNSELIAVPFISLGGDLELNDHFVPGDFDPTDIRKFLRPYNLPQDICSLVILRCTRGGQTNP